MYQLVADIVFILLYSLFCIVVYKLLFEEGEQDDKEKGYENVEKREAKRSSFFIYIIGFITVGIVLFYSYKYVDMARILSKPWKGTIRPDFIAQSKKAIIEADPAYVNYTWIGAGNFGDVFALEDESDKVSYVVKDIDLLHMHPTDVNKCIREAQLLYYLRGKEGIIQLYSAHLWDNHLLLKEEYMNRGSLRRFAFLGRQFKSCTVRQASAIAKQILKALVALHELHIIHRDVKPDNIMMNSAGDAKLIDFGVSTRPYVEETAHWGQVGTPIFFSPQVMSGEPYYESADIWSLGATIMSLFTTIYDLSSLNIQLRRVVLPNMFKNFPIELYSRAQPLFDHLPEGEMRDFCQQCMQRDPKKRPSARQLLSHPFIINAGNNWDVAALVDNPKEAAAPPPQSNQI